MSPCSLVWLVEKRRRGEGRTPRDMLAIAGLNDMVVVSRGFRPCSARR